MSENNPSDTKTISAKKKGNKKFIRLLEIANARYFENGDVSSFDAYRSPYAIRRKRGRTAS